MKFALLIVALAGVAFFAVAPEVADRRMNVVVRPSPKVEPTADTLALHRQAFIADMHADTLLWARNWNKRNDFGHVDIPRLKEGHVSLQIFDVVTKTPRKMNIERNDDSTDNIRLIAMAQGWPLKAQNSLYERALFQAEQLHKWVDKSQGALTFVTSRATLESPAIGVMLGMEGAHAIERIDQVDTLFDAGFRLVGLAHFFDNAWAGSAHGVGKGGLTKAGRELVATLEKKRILIDLAHASPATVDDVLAIATRPVVVSHTGVRGTCDNARNLSDAQLRRIAEKGGIIGIAFFSNAVCTADHASIVKAIQHAVRIMGDDHVALGSDFDGAVTTPFDASQLAELTQAMRSAGLDDAVVKKILGENLRGFFRTNLPD